MQCPSSFSPYTIPTMPEPELPDYNVTPALKAFIRAELALVLSFDDPEGEQWNYLSLAKTISDSDDFPGRIGDDTIARFLKPEARQRTSKQTLMILAGFLLISEHITEEDLEHYSKPGYSRAAASLGDLFIGNSSRQDRSLVRALQGEYRLYRRNGHNGLLETTLVVASPDQGRSLTVSETRTAYWTDDLDYVMEETEYLGVTHYATIPELIERSTQDHEARFAGYGVGVATSQILLFLIGGEDAPSHSVLNVTEIAHDGQGRITGLKGRRAADWVRSVDGEIDEARPTDRARLFWSEYFGRFELYPQGIVGLEAPKFVTGDEDAQKESESGGGLGFISGPATDMEEHERQLLKADAIEDSIEAALLECRDATERLFVAIDLLRSDHAIKAIEEGADVNARHPAHDLPAIHTAASYGMRKVVRAILETGKCDLTVRDNLNRLASTCADNSAGDFVLRDELVEAQTKQFREKGIDPRRSTVPDYGAYTLS